MGQSTPTTTIALEVFAGRYAAYRSELPPREQAWFDELISRARRHSNAINRRPHLDFERPVLLAMILETLREIESAREANDALQSQLNALHLRLAQAGLLERRVAVPSAEELGRMGQQVLAEAEA